jgi:RNA polymerase sigma-70 factor (ECF subfamily)
MEPFSLRRSGRGRGYRQGPSGEALGGEPPDGEATTQRRVYCLVPRDIAPKVHDQLRTHFRDDRSMQVIVDRRESERRAADRRQASPDAEPEIERRTVRNVAGRRVDDRRAVAAVVEPWTLPRRARRFADRLVFIERVEPSAEHLEDVDTARTVLRVQQGDTAGFDTLYLRYFDRIYGYFRVALGDAHEAQDATQDVFLRAFNAVGRYELQLGTPFRAWLFRIARNVALKRVRAEKLVDRWDPHVLEREGGMVVGDPTGPFDWIADGDLLFLIERLPHAQRQTITMRYLLGMSTPEIAAAMTRTPVAVRHLESRALRFLEARLTSMNIGPTEIRRAPMEARLRRAPVLMARRFALFSRAAYAPRPSAYLRRLS